MEIISIKKGVPGLEKFYVYHVDVSKTTCMCGRGGFRPPSRGHEKRDMACIGRLIIIGEGCLTFCWLGFLLVFLLVEMQLKRCVGM